MKVLIVDDEVDIAVIVEFYVSNYFPSSTHTLLAHSGFEAIEILKKNPDIDICISDHNMANGLGSEVLDYIAQTKSETKFVLCSTVSYTASPSKYPIEFLFHSIQKPEIGNGVKELFDKTQTQSSAPEINRDLDNNEYLPISTGLLLLLKAAPADLYLKVSDSKFLKCIHKSEKFDQDDHRKYYKKSIDKLFIKKGDQSQILHKIVLDLIHDIMDRDNLPMGDKISIAHNQLTTLFHFSGITPELEEASRKNILKSYNLIASSTLANNFWEKLNLLGNYPSRLYTLHSILASAVINQISGKSEDAYSLVFASFLKDIALDSISLLEICDFQEFQEKKDTFPPADIKKYIDNPIRANEILVTSFKEYPANVTGLLLEQHEMPNGDGSPRKLNADDIPTLSCVFILTGIFARHLLRSSRSFNFQNFISTQEARGYSKGNFAPVFEVIKKMENYKQES